MKTVNVAQKDTLQVLAMTSSTTPIVRGGRANLALPILAIGLVLLWKVAEVEGLGRYLLGGFVLWSMAIGWQSYYTTLTRLTFRDEYLEIMFPLRAVRLRYDAINGIKFRRHTLSPIASLKIFTSTSSRVVRVNIAGSFTPWGSLDECVQKLRKELIARGVKPTD